VQQRWDKHPAWDASARPVKMKCPGKHVYGWVYPDGTLELICRESKCKRPGHETRHLFNPETGEMFSVFVDKPQQ
jgi:hypothetical protein